MSSLHSLFRPTRWLPGGHLQTLYSPLFRAKPRLQRQRERLTLQDGDFIDLDWYGPQGEQTRRSGTVVRLEMNRQGRIIDCRCVTSSGSVGYDETVMQAVRAVQTLPAPPAGYPTTSIEIEFIRMEK